ncbi:hypothetical protein NFI96_023538 [Prochilodus magdalenae]|nr:hypothetical protein NFI96_023538 [Prochilodus magdalenae]
MKKEQLYDHNVVSLPTITADGTAERRGNMELRNHNEVGDGGGGGDVSYASLNIPNSGQRRLKKRTAESSDLCTYSEVKAERV